MHEIRDIRPEQLLLDSKNPRLERIEDRQLEALHGLWRNVGKMLGLARHISEKGLDPTARLAVVKATSGSHDYVVLEGNRRLAALKALVDPASVADILKPAEKAKLELCSAAYRQAPVALIPCAVFASPAEAEPWIELRHSADPTGAGVLMWGAAEKSRFKSRMGIAEPALQIVDLVKAEGHLTPAQSKALMEGKYITTLRRFTNDPEVRKRLNISRDAAGAITFSSPRKETVKALSKIVSDFATGAKTVKDVYQKSDRRAYLESLEDSGSLPVPPPSGPATAPPRSRPAPAGGGRVTGIPGGRVKLFRPGIALTFGREARIAKVFAELRALKPDEFPNAVAVLFRVFLELSVDHYLVKTGQMTTAELNATRNLSKKIRTALDYMTKGAMLDEQQLKPLNRALQKTKGIVGPAHLESLHAYIHNRYYDPRPDDLRFAADDWQPFIEKIWS